LGDRIVLLSPRTLALAGFVFALLAAGLRVGLGLALGLTTAVAGVLALARSRVAGRFALGIGLLLVGLGLLGILLVGLGLLGIAGLRLFLTALVAWLRRRLAVVDLVLLVGLRV